MTITMMDGNDENLGDEGASLLHLGRVRCDSHKSIRVRIKLLLQAGEKLSVQKNVKL